MTQNMFIDSLKNLNSYSQIIDGIEKNNSPIALHGLSGENISHISHGINQHLDRQVLIITYDELKAKTISEDLNFFDKENSEIFPSRDIVFYDVDAFSHDISNQRLKVLDRLCKGENIIVVSSINAIINKIMSPDGLRKYIGKLKFGQIVELETLGSQFIAQGYERVDMIEGKGQFAIRGGIIDFFPINSEIPFRVELFDEEVDSIRTFDIKTQRSIDNIKEVDIPPVKEVLIEDDQIEQIIENIKEDLNISLKKLEKNKSLKEIKEKLSEKFNNYIDRIDNKLNISNLDIVLPYISENISNLINYFKDDAIIIVDEPQRIEESMKDFKSEFMVKYTDLFERGEVLSKQQNIYYSLEEIVEDINKKNCITSTNLLKNTSLFKPKAIINFGVKGMQSFHNKLDILVEDLNHYKYRGYKVIILCGVEERGKRLLHDLKDSGIECSFVEDGDREIKSGQVFITPGSVSRGFEYSALKLAIISDKEIFGTNKKKKTFKSRKDAAPISSFTDLKIGDHVVHESHGIGKYLGIEQLKVQGVKKDYMTVKYSGEDRLYVPIDQMNLIQKYIGSDSGDPKVNKLGSGDWVKTKTKVKKQIEDMAKDLIKLYATRHTIKGYKFSEDTPWQKQFEDAFPYQETDDQLRSISEIKTDMETEKPMDRLLCGDVGYGKTEVALRAAFKAVMDGKQVAILVPTTILAQQHYNTLVERFADFPVKVEMLSRFRTAGQQKKIINDLKSGNLDILVGTHRILSKDVKLNNLGLLIIDEEQRFGVKHKEAIKILKESVDVLTLTATPIPRTLHMSLIGIRDMSVLEEPPEERYPIQTYVVEYNEQMLRDAIVKELSRNGQIYILYNRVQTISEFSAKIQRLVPEARITVAHGQMSERELEKVMLEFLKGEYDVLVCTTIIETGLDIPNVNTIIIHDADKMGLSQLYQLRGRVGRSNRIAFSYFTYEKDKVLTEVAEKRLRAIKEFTEFGSGFKIAMRDLEIRGAGNLLGGEQHGQMAAIGYDLYVKYLDEAIKRLRGEQREEKVETSIELNVDGYIPDRYIRNEDQKIEVYKRISAIENKSDYSDILEEIIDRFGDVPKQVVNLINISYIKSLCSRAKISSIKQIDKLVKIEFIEDKYITLDLMNELLSRFGSNIQFDISRNPSIKYKLKGNSQEDILSELEDVAGKISSFINASK
ncbi:transcription-repair-coupling factor Mfd [Gottschalkia acidurici 9a]|uniref:Transcription-repair-coupling factor n=1 Tax=Gottschalkia acidurici (strain ATCC 7906 / DSM 604 / BCRC 14475 / CIP 104303 / KCTC 5404 / NCIMB 10678 / 9a) TaxID=1128398 RepID=K0B012_GOTA9|nr:transcription-repair coupling factor [Gottschalkia acidurici]AFS79378.1 transcription-repair-coupling factor Mfd [Gottschalkia acidurici 9a]